MSFIAPRDFVTATALCQWPWATSMAMGSKTWPWPTMVPTTSRCSSTTRRDDQSTILISAGERLARGDLCLNFVVTQFIEPFQVRAAIELLATRLKDLL